MVQSNLSGSASNRDFFVGGRKLAAKEWGEIGGTPVLALHGWLDNAGSFDPMFESLVVKRRDLHIVALDHAGHGFSDWRSASQDYDIRHYVDDVCEIIGQLGWSQFALLGHSLGAGVSSLYAAQFPDQVHSLCLIESLGPVSKEWSPPVLNRMMPSQKQNQVKPSRRFANFELAVRARMAGLWPLERAAAKKLAERGVTETENEAFWHHDPRLRSLTSRLSEAEIRQALNRLSMPVHLMLGLQGNKARWPMLEERMACIPHLQVTELEGGHHLHLEQQALACAEWLNNILEKH
ncbi:alpha/beta fold hydrolase [Pokkaliibacter sp. CJK22405]|uniref:alpha/beta fold hydrolase n=1 Tax=Pokkaliibacter sp. CJK22405 TaxID=3384615 RepID=UPI003984B5D2